MLKKVYCALRQDVINDVMCEISTAPSSNVTPCDLVDALLLPLIAMVLLVSFLPNICTTFFG